MKSFLQFVMKKMEHIISRTTFIKNIQIAKHSSRTVRTAINSCQTPFRLANTANIRLPRNGPTNQPIPAKLIVPIARTIIGSRPSAAAAAASRSRVEATERPVAVVVNAEKIEKTRPVTLLLRRRSKKLFQFRDDKFEPVTCEVTAGAVALAEFDAAAAVVDAALPIDDDNILVLGPELECRLTAVCNPQDGVDRLE